MYAQGIDLPDVPIAGLLRHRPGGLRPSGIVLLALHCAVPGDADAGAAVDVQQRSGDV